MLDCLRIALALLPLGIYFVLVAWLLARREPTLLNSTQDTLLLGMGCVGLAVIGPMELFFPNAAYSVLGEWTWCFLLGLYFFIVLFVSLNRKPNWTLYGMDLDSSRALLNQAMDAEGIEYEWMDRVLRVPSLGMLAMLEPANATGNVTYLSASGWKQDILGWHRLEKLVLQSKHWKTITRFPHRTGNWMLWASIGATCIVAAFILAIADMERLQRTVAWWFSE
jgi:hypothetical protein